MDIEKVMKILKSLSDRSRLLIVKSLSAKPQYLEELAQRLALASSTVSFHLRKLEEAGLVAKKKQQYYTIFFLKKDFIEVRIRDLINCDYGEEDMQKERIRAYKDKVLKSFFRNGRLTRIPAQKQKRWIVFEKILADFEFDRDYPETELNGIISRYHDDYCQIRRTFVEENVFHRKDNVYRLTKSYERFRKGEPVQSPKHGLIESYEQSVRDKFGVQV